MDGPRVLVLEPDKKAQADFKRAFESLNYPFEVSGSIDDAIKRAQQRAYQVIIVDVAALWAGWEHSGEGSRRWSSEFASASKFTGADVNRDAVEHLTEVFKRFRHSLHHVGEHEAVRPLRILVTFGKENLAEHATVMAAGADAYLSGLAASTPGVLRTYISYSKRVRTTDRSTLPHGAAILAPRLRPATPRIANRIQPSAAVAAPAAVPLGTSLQNENRSELRHATDLFNLPDATLRNAESGRWDAKRIATSLGIELTALVEAIRGTYSTVAKTPDSEALQPRLAPFANVLAVLMDAFEGNGAGIRMWLNTPQPLLSGKRPIEVALRPGGVAGVEQLVISAWLGDPL